MYPHGLNRDGEHEFFTNPVYSVDKQHSHNHNHNHNNSSTQKHLPTINLILNTNYLQSIEKSK